MAEEEKKTKVEIEKKEEKVETPKEEKVETSKEESKTEEKAETKKPVSKPAVEKISKKTSEKKEKVELEREYVVPLRRGSLNVPQYKRAKKAVRVLKEFIVKHMKVYDRDLSKVKIDMNLNNEIWFRGIKKPLHKVKVKAKKVDGIVYVTLAEIPEIVAHNIAKLAKKNSRAKKVEAPKHEKVKDDDDKDKDGVSDKKEEKEDSKSEAVKDSKTNKDLAKAEKHSTKGPHQNAKPMINQPKKN